MARPWSSASSFSILEVISLASFTLGSFLFLCITLLWPIPRVLAAAPSTIGVFATQAHFRPALPTHIQIVGLLSLPVTQTNYSGDEWEISDTAASFPITAARPGEAGNIVIYSHNRQSLFAPLAKAKINDDIRITTENQTVHHYRITHIVTTNADDTSWVRPESSEVLTLYTCTGFLDLKRLVIRAVPIPES